MKHRTNIFTIASTPYTYRPLNKATGEIRLLTLHPANFKDQPSHFDNHAVHTVGDYAPVLEAFSYAWGSPENPVVILVRDSSNVTLPVTRNLGEALLYLRYEDRPRIL